MNEFKDKVIWITGASSGIGEALALEFARRGARLILSARREQGLIEVGKRTGLAPLDLMILPFDLLDTSNSTGLAAQVMNKFGRIDLLVNNGGMSQRAAASDTPSTLERQLMEVNYFSYVNLSKAVLPYMKRQNAGYIIVLSSIAGKFGFYLRSSYSAAKHALHGYFESLRLENEDWGLRVLMVCPGKVKTNVSLNALKGDGEKHNQMDESHAEAMSAETCATQILRALAKNKKEVYIGGKEILMIRIRRFFPSLFESLIRKQSAF